MMLGLILGIAWSICGITCFVKLDQAYEEDRKKRIFLGIFFVFFGVCGLLGFFLKNNKLSFTSLMLSAALLCILLFIYAWYQVCSCKTPVTAVYLHYNEYSGGRGQRSYAPVFRYTYGGREYERQTYEAYSHRKIEKLFTPGETYQILINEKSPMNCVSCKRVASSNYVICLMGIIFLIIYISVMITV